MGNSKQLKGVTKRNFQKPNQGLSREEKKLIKQIQNALSFDLLNKDMQKVVKPTDHFTRGHCYVAAEAFFYLYGREAGYVARGRDYHWWLEHKTTGRIVDPTAEQLKGPFDYSVAKSYHFMPKSPKHATEELMRRVVQIRERRNKSW